MSKLVLNRIEDKVYYNDIELKINKQSSKGPGNEVVYIKDLPESNGQTWISLKKLNEGLNEFECKPKTYTHKEKYTLTDDEQKRITELQNEITKIIETAKQRYVEEPTLTIKQVDALSNEDRLAYIDNVKKYLESLLNN